MPGGLRGFDGALERSERGARVAAGALGEQGERLVIDRRRVGDASLRVGQRSIEQQPDVVRRERAKLVDLRPREQRRVDLEVRVLGRRPDQGDEALLNRGQQRILLGLVEAVDLVQEEDRRLAISPAPLLGALDDRSDLRLACVHGGLLLEGRVRRRGDDAREGRLARPGWAVENH